LLAEHVRRLRPILAKAKAGKRLSGEEEELLGGAGPGKACDSIGAAAARMNLTVGVVRKAKRMGAPGFKGSRVYPELLQPWIAENLDRLTDKTKDQIEEERLRGLKWDNDLKDRLYVKRGEVEAWITDLAEKIKNVLRKKLRNELPPKLEGLRAAEISAKMEGEVIGPICRLLRFEPEAQSGTRGNSSVQEDK